MRGEHETRSLKKKAILVLLFVIIALTLLYCGGRYLETRNETPETRTAYVPLHQWGNKIELDGEAYYQRRRVTTILLIGVDERETGQGNGYRSGGQADFLRLIVVDNDDRRVSQMAIDRDTMTPIKVLGVLGSGSRTRTAQISLSHGFGDGRETSCELTLEAVSNLLSNTQIDFYMAMSMDGIQALNDVVGGVTVTLEDDFTEKDPAMVKGATLTLMGSQAETYVRGRMNVGAGTNEARMARQQQYISGLIEKLYAQTHENKQFINTVFDAIEPYLVTNITRGRLMNEVWGAKDYALEPVMQPAGKHVVSDDGFMQFFVDEDSLQQIVLELFYEKQ